MLKSLIVPTHDVRICLEDDSSEFGLLGGGIRSVVQHKPVIKVYQVAVAVSCEAG